jgi:protein SCO1/2
LRRGAQKFNSVDIRAPITQETSRDRSHGVKRTLADYRGKVVAVFFGFTQCPTLPTTLSDLARQEAVG